MTVRDADMNLEQLAVRRLAQATSTQERRLWQKIGRVLQRRKAVLR